MKQLYRQFKKYRIFAIVGFILVLVSVIPVRLAIAFGSALSPEGTRYANAQSLLLLLPIPKPSSLSVVAQKEKNSPPK